MMNMEWSILPGYAREEEIRQLFEVACGKTAEYINLVEFPDDVNKKY